MKGSTVFIADAHIWNHKAFGGAIVAGLNERCRFALGALDGAVKLARRVGAARFASLGDLTDGVRPEPQILAAVQGIAAESELDWLILKGNHEMVSEARGDHALGPLGALPNAAVIADEPRWIGVMGGPWTLYVPFRMGPAREWLPEVLGGVEDPPGKGARVLALHLGIIDGQTAPWLRNAHDAVPLEMLLKVCEARGFQAVVSGNWHTRAVWVGTDFKGPGADGDEFHVEEGAPPVICQVGTLSPTGWDNPGIDGYGSAIEVGRAGKHPLTLVVHEVPGPRFLAFKGDQAHEAGAEKLAREGYKFYVRREVAAEDVLAVRGQALPWAQAVDVTSDGVSEASALRGAAVAAKSAGTLDEAVAAFVERMNVPAGVPKETVLARVRGYLARRS